MSIYETSGRFPSVIALAEEMMKGKSGVTTYDYDYIAEKETKKILKHAVYMPIDIGNTFWSIVVATPENEALAAMKGFRNRWFAIIGLLVAGLFVRAGVGDTPTGGVATLVIFGTATWLSLRASQVRRGALRVAEALIPLATVLAIVMLVLGTDETGALVGAFVSMLLVVVAPIVILRRLLSHPVINLNTFYGAVSVYLLIAMFFATLFSIIGAAHGGQFFVQIEKATGIDYIYFSFTTITTVGYGDLTAVTSVGRLTAVMEAVFGQLYLITVVALVVQNLGRDRLQRQQRDDGEEEVKTPDG